MHAPPLVAGDNRRNTTDRRQRPTPMFSRHALFGGRRQACRRQKEQVASFVDNHGTGLFLVVNVVLALNTLDALFTVLFLSYGAREINPLVAASLESGLGMFLTMKSVGIGICVVFLTLTKNFRVSRLGLGVVSVGYGLLMAWHAYLYFNLASFVGE
ncbi:MAG: DUF5658 family protein [Planctomycetota bacterium]